MIKRTMAGGDIDTIKERLSMVEVVSSYVKLQKAGGSYKGKSPFTNENTPSFFVSPEKNLFHCFSSGKGGDIFTFIQEVEHIDFRDALKMLAERAGVTLSKTDSKERSERSQLFELMDYATKAYEVSFRKDADAVQYLLDRGMTKDTMADFRVGYAPAGWSFLYDQLRKKGFADALIEKSGLCVRGDKGLYDRFRERIMFPIMDGQGRVIAFSGRIFLKPGSDTDPKATGKYVNSPETPLYHKSEVLYGYDKAKRTMMQEDKCIIVEGQMDLVMSHQAGVTNAVAISGTALTDEQVGLIRRFTDNIIIALDADPAGIKAAGRSVQIAYANDMMVSIVGMQPGTDPADLVKTDPEQWKQLLATAQDYIDFRLDTLKQSDGSTRDKTKAIRTDIYPFVGSIKGAIEADEALKKVAHFLGSSMDVVRKDFTDWRHEHGDEIIERTAPPVPETSHINAPPFEEALFGILLWQDSADDTTIDTQLFKNRYKEIVGENWYQSAWSRATENQNSLIFQAELRYDALTPEELVREIDHLLTRALVRSLEKQQKILMEKIRKAEQSGNEEQSNQYLQDHQAVTRKLEELATTDS